MGIQTELDRIEAGKAKVAQAVTAKGVETANDASFDTISENIEKISSEALPDGYHTLTILPPDKRIVIIRDSDLHSIYDKQIYYFKDNMGIYLEGWITNPLYKIKGWEINGTIINSSFPNNVILYNTGNDGDKNLTLIPEAIESNWSLQKWDNYITGIKSNENIVIAITSKNEIKYSDDGITWQLVTNIPDVNFTFYNLYCENNRFFIFPSFGTKGLTSTDGKNWQSIDTSLTSIEGNINLTYGNGKYLFLAQDQTSQSTDGITWEKIGTPGNRWWLNIAYGNNKFVGTSQKSTDSATYYINISEDGINWTSNIFFDDLDSLTYGNGKFVAINAYEKEGWAIIWSIDGINWTTSLTLRDIMGPANDYLCLHQNNTIDNLFFDGSKFYFTLYSSPYIFYSTDAITWYKTILPADNHWLCAAQKDGTIVTGGYSYLAYISENNLSGEKL